VCSLIEAEHRYDVVWMPQSSPAPCGGGASGVLGCLARYASADGASLPQLPAQTPPHPTPIHPPQPPAPSTGRPLPRDLTVLVPDRWAAAPPCSARHGENRAAPTDIRSH
jgi:hypothetical protein